MAITLELLTIPIGSILTSTIASDEADSKNDFTALILTSENGTGLTESDITLSSGTLVSLTGSGASWQATLRPPETAEVITMTVAADAFTEGNAETTHDIRVSTSFPDDDAETPALLFNPNLSAVSGIAVTPTEILLAASVTNTNTLKKYTHSGTDTGESLTIEHLAAIDYINGDFLLGDAGIFGSEFSRYRVSDGAEVFSFRHGGTFGRGAMHTRLGYVGYNLQPPGLRFLPYAYESETAYSLEYDLPEAIGALTHQNDIIYVYRYVGTPSFIAYAEILSDDTVEYKQRLNVYGQIGAGTFRDIAIYGDTLYFTSAQTAAVYTIDIRPYRPIAKNTKNTIYPVFVNEGDTIDLTQYSPDAERIVPEVGFDKPDFLTFNTSNELEIDADAVTETHPVYIPLKAINRIDATETGSFGFYLIIQQATDPIWREFDDLSMPADSVFNLFDVVEGATGITLQSGPTGASVSNGRLTIGTQGGTVVVRATNDSGNTNHTFIANVVQAGDPANYSNEFRYRVQIANIDVTSDLKVSPSVSESLDRGHIE